MSLYLSTLYNQLIENEISNFDLLKDISELIQDIDPMLASDKLAKKLSNVFKLGIKSNLLAKVKMSQSDFKYLNLEDKHLNKYNDEQIYDIFKCLLKKWIQQYLNAPDSYSTNYQSSKSKSADDPALTIIVKTFLENNGYDYDENSKNIHKLFMNAENIQGNLLEEYIASKICNDTYGFIWCKGSIIQATDFCYIGDKKSYLIQIKNRDNTENSSSSAIRDDTNIIKWNRLSTRTKNYQPYPIFHWDKLNDFINDIISNEDEFNLFSETNYSSFLINTLNNNKNILYYETEKEDG